MFLRDRIVFTDLETTGLEKLKLLNPTTRDLVPWAEICEIGLVLVDYKTLEVVDTFDAKVKINYPYRVEPEAAILNGYNENDWLYARELRDVLEAYNRFAAEATFAAHNAAFDRGFLEIAYAKEGLESKLRGRPIIDTQETARSITESKGYTLDSFSLKNLAAFLGLEPEPLPHRALNGAMLSYRIFKALRGLKQNDEREHSLPQNPGAGCHA